MENEFPPNSHHTRKEARPERPTEKAPARVAPERITRNKATLRKKPLRKKFIDAFRPEDNVGFMEHMLLEVLVPSIKDAIAFSSTEFIENALGVGSRPRSRRSSRDGYTSYNRMSEGRPRSRRERDDERRTSRTSSRGPSDYQEAIVDTRVEGEEILERMFELISMYGTATMRDLLSMLGEPHTFTDEDWGWTDLRGARIHALRGGRDGYLIDLPRAEPLD